MYFRPLQDHGQSTYVDAEVNMIKIIRWNIFVLQIHVQREI